MSAYPEVVYWLTLINQSNLKLNVVKPIIQRWRLAEERPLSSLFDLSALEWSTTFGLADDDAEKAAATANRLAQQAQILAQWQAQGIEAIIRTDPHYPTQLIQTLPPAKQPLVLWARGAIELLDEATVAILGEESPAEDTMETVEAMMQAVAAEDMGLVSGYGRGLDRAAFETMLQTEEGRAVVMLPMGLSAFAKTTSKLEAAVAAERVVLVSPFAPDAPYQERLAEARNLLIDHLAFALLVLNTDSAAETRAAAALDRGLPVFVSLTDTAGNRALIDRGALLLTDPGEVIELVQQAVIDTRLSETTTEEEAAAASQAPLLPPAPTALSTTADPNENFALRHEDVEPIDSDEALDILSMGGEVPELLRRRLKKKAGDEETE